MESSPTDTAGTEPAVSMAAKTPSDIQMVRGLLVGNIDNNPLFRFGDDRVFRDSARIRDNADVPRGLSEYHHHAEKYGEGRLPGKQ